MTGTKLLRGGVHSRKIFIHTYEDIISIENLLAAWKEFVRGKRKKADVQEFQYRLMDNVLSLHRDLKDKTYQHGGYHAFKISDPKPRDIHKASVRDRLLHHALYRKLYPYFDQTFIHDSYSCRLGKGTHRAMVNFCAHARKVSHNHTRTTWVLKCDIRKFFASIDHAVLHRVLHKLIADPAILWLLQQVIGSFKSEVSQANLITLPAHDASQTCLIGLPLGNLTSQLLVNIYLNEFDQFIKHKLNIKHYVRYADDFVILSHDKQYLQATLGDITRFLKDQLKLELHPSKISLTTFASGIDFLGWVHFSDHRILRTATKKRMFRRLDERKGTEGEEGTKASYLGMLKHGDTYKLREKVAVY